MLGTTRFEVETTVEGKKFQAAGNRLCFGTDADGKGPVVAKEYTLENLNADIQDLFAKFPGLTPARLAEELDSNILRIRWYQDANRPTLGENGALTQEEIDQNALERANGTGRGGARGPRLSDQNCIDAGLALAKKDAAYVQLADLINGAKLTELPTVISELKSAFTAAGFTVDQVKALAKG